MLYSSLDISVTVGGTTTVYYSKDIRLSDQGARIEGENSAAIVIRKAYRKKGYLTGTATLMYPNAAGAVYPPALTPFTMTIPEVQAAAISCIIFESAPARSNDGEAVCTITFDQVINTLTVGS